jgi:hypothetical protein
MMPSSADIKNELVHKKSRGLGKKTFELRAAVTEVFATFAGSMSSRQVFYQLVSRGDLPNNAKACRLVSGLLVKMRRDGALPYDRVVDRTRGVHRRSSWSGVEALMSGAAQHYRRNLWAEQAIHVHICCEKQALEGIFSEVVDQYGAPLWTLRGFSSESFLYEWAEEIKDLNSEGREVVIAFFGDHDPSGLALETDCQKRLRTLGAEFTWERKGLLWKDFETHDLVNVDVKKKDSRSKRYLEQFGNRAAELDALPPDVLRERIAVSVAEHIDLSSWLRVKETEAHERDTLNQVVSKWEDIVGLVRELKVQS